MSIKKIEKYSLGVVLTPLGAVSGVIQDENFFRSESSDIQHGPEYLCTNLYNYSYNFSKVTVLRLFYSFLSPLGAISGVIRAEFFLDPVQVTFCMV